MFDCRINGERVLARRSVNTSARINLMRRASTDPAAVASGFSKCAVTDYAGFVVALLKVLVLRASKPVSTGPTRPCTLLGSLHPLAAFRPLERVAALPGSDVSIDLATVRLVPLGSRFACLGS